MDRHEDLPADIGLEERLRRAALFASGALATRGNPVLRAIAERAAALLATPIAAVSIVDRDRQWFPAVIGWESEGTARELSFCSRAIAAPARMLCIPDTLADPAFATNALVTGQPGIRFYAGAALQTVEGTAIGTVCAIDVVPRPPLAPEQWQSLRGLAAEAVAEIGQIDHLRQSSACAIEGLLEQIRDAIRRGAERELEELDQILQSVERRLAED